MLKTVFLLAVMLCPQLVVAALPQRIVSLNLCTDQWLLLLAERNRIASLTWLSADPEESPLAAEAQGIVLNYGQAEDIIPLQPDLILAGTYTARFTVDLL
ncbi:MAG: ABC transporter substrate-binding protein, partial [Candidatus Competibacteraceae bacterium]|nr:ABC transporter substrate-binding protein [Candidatus Competibacteraceae bacterium]